MQEKIIPQHKCLLRLFSSLPIQLQLHPIVCVISLNQGFFITREIWGNLKLDALRYFGNWFPLGIVDLFNKRVLKWGHRKT